MKIEGSDLEKITIAALEAALPHLPGYAKLSIQQRETPEKNYNAFWKEILEDETGNIDKEQLMKELSDFSFILEQLPLVYMRVSGGYLSKPNYHADTVIAKFEDLIKKEREEAIKDAIEYEEVVPRDKVDTLYDAIAHGDEKHRAWLKEAIDKHFEIEQQSNQ